MVGIRTDALQGTLDRQKAKTNSLEVIFLGEEQECGMQVWKFFMEDVEGIGMPMGLEEPKERGTIFLQIDIPAIQAFDRETEKTISC